MHMADALVSPAVAGAACSSVGDAACSVRTKDKAWGQRKYRSTHGGNGRICVLQHR